MKITNNDLLLYVITDRKLLKGTAPDKAVEAALAGGATMVQLREKELCEEDFIKEALAVKKVTEKYGVPLIINDNINVCIKSGADGVHLGQKDMNAAEARKILGENKIIGVSAKTPEQAVKAETDGADYLGVGAAFSTTTKQDASCVSHSVYKQIKNAVSIPVAAIGGINLSNIAKLKNSGINGVAVVGSVFGSADIKYAAKELKGLSVKYFYD